MYSNEIVFKILQGFALSKDIGNLSYDLKLYSPQVVNTEVLQNEFLRYVQNNIQKGLKPRNVCFLLKTDNDQDRAAVFLELFEIDSIKLHALRQQQTPITAEDIKGLYSKVTCIFVHTKPQIKMWDNYLQETYSPKKSSYQEIEKYSRLEDIVFTDILLKLLQNDESSTVDETKAVTQQRSYAARAILEMLKKIKSEDASAYKKIVEHLTVILKYVEYQKCMSLCKLPELKDTPLKELEVISKVLLEGKKKIYAEKILKINNERVEKINLAFLVEMLKCEGKSTETLLKCLEDERKKQCAFIKKYDAGLQQLIQSKQPKKSWGSYLWSAGEKSWDAVNNVTFVGLGGQLTKYVVKTMPNSIRETGVKCLTTIGLGKQITEYANISLSEEEILKIFEVVGMGLGGLGSFYLASYSFVAAGWNVTKSSSAVIMGNYLKDYFHQEVNDETAMVSSSFLGASGYFKISNILIAAAESCYTRNPKTLLFSIGGATFNATSVDLNIFFAKGILEKCCPGLKERYQPSTEAQALIIQFLHLAGYEVGKVMTEYGYGGLERFLAREGLKEAFCEMMKQEHENCVVDFSERPIRSYDFWFNPEDKVRLGRTFNAGEFYQEAACNITYEGKAVRCEPFEEPTSKRVTSN